MALTKTTSNIISLQALTSAPRQVISSVLDLSSAYGATIGVRIGRAVETALTLPVIVRVELSMADSGNGYWIPVYTVQGATTAAASEALTGTEAIGSTVLECASTTGFAVGDIILIKNSTVGNSEWARVAVVTTNTSLTVEEGIIAVQTGSTVYNQGELYHFPIDGMTGAKRARVVVDGSGAGQDFVVDAYGIVCT
jgi:hypothetical protein